MSKWKIAVSRIRDYIMNDVDIHINGSVKNKPFLDAVKGIDSLTHSNVGGGILRILKANIEREVIDEQ